MQYTHHMIVNFISDSVMQKFLRFAYAKFSNDFFSKMRGRNKNFDFKFEFSIKFCVGLYVMIWWRSRAIFKFLFILLSGATTSSDRQKNHCNITSDKGLSDDIWLMNMTSSMTSQSNCNLLQFLMSFSRISAYASQPTTIIFTWKWSQE